MNVQDVSENGKPNQLASRNEVNPEATEYDNDDRVRLDFIHYVNKCLKKWTNAFNI